MAHDSGLDNVPHDGYEAVMHPCEAFIGTEYGTLLIKHVGDDFVVCIDDDDIYRAFGHGMKLISTYPTGTTLEDAIADAANQRTG